MCYNFLVENVAPKLVGMTMGVHKVLGKTDELESNKLTETKLFRGLGVRSSLNWLVEYKLAPVTVLSPLADSAAGLLSGSVAS